MKVEPVSLGPAYLLWFSVGPDLHSRATSNCVAFSFVLLPAPIMSLLLPLEIPGTSINQCCTPMLHNWSPQNSVTCNKKHLYNVHGSGGQLSEAQLIYTEAHLGGSASSPSWVWVCPTCVHSGFKQQKFREGSSHWDVCGIRRHAQLLLLKPYPFAFHCPKASHMAKSNTKGGRKILQSQ